MTGDQIIEHARRGGYHVIVTEVMVTEALARISSPFTCRDVVEAIPRDDRGATVSEHLVALWLEDLIRRCRVRWTGAERPRTYEVVVFDARDRDRMHCGELSYDLGYSIEWCSVCGALRVNAEGWIEPKRGSR